MLCDSSILMKDEASLLTHIITKDQTWYIFDETPLLESFTLLHDETAHLFDVAMLIILQCPRVLVDWVSFDRCTLLETKHLSITTTTFYGDGYDGPEKLPHYTNSQRMSYTVEAPEVESLHIRIKLPEWIHPKPSCIHSTCLTHFNYPKLTHLAIEHITIVDELMLPSITEVKCTNCLFTMSSLLQNKKIPLLFIQCFLIKNKNILHITFPDFDFITHKYSFADTLLSIDPTCSRFTSEDVSASRSIRDAVRNPSRHYS